MWPDRVSNSGPLALESDARINEQMVILLRQGNNLCLGSKKLEAKNKSFCYDLTLCYDLFLSIIHPSVFTVVKVST